MAIISAFIGINKHLDPKIRELTGARRDATALWALFTDSIPGIAATLLVDADGTLENIRKALSDTMGAATPDDVVIVSFSGHGTHDHRLVAHNTAADALHETTLPMDELAEGFHVSRARAIICILDCCFSGGAPARVLEASPIPRDPTVPFDQIAGKGRIIITASGVHEPAWELPSSGHGILTKAILDVATHDEAPFSIPAIMDKVQERIRSEAARMGVTQTPVLFGYIEGGLTMPPLRPGDHYRSAFPETRKSQVNGAIGELTAFGFPSKIVEAWKAQFPTGLNSLQIEAVNRCGVLDGQSSLVIAPTSSGKTFIGEMAAVRVVVAGQKAVFLLPYRALVNEKYEQFETLYGGVDMRVVRCTGDYSDQTSAIVRGKYDLAILTYEMFLNLVVGNPAILHQIGLVVVDEAQFVTDPNRGISVELLLTLIIAARERGVRPQLLALSAVIGGINDFDAWLGCQSLIVTSRPIPLIEGVLDRTGLYRHIDSDGKEQIAQLIPANVIRVRRDKPNAQDVVVPLVRQLVSSGEQVIVFRNQKGPAQGCANYLAHELGLPRATEALTQLPNHDLSSTSTLLRECLQGGTAFHNTNLTREEKAVVERFFRRKNGGVRVLAATTTVAAGINTPASTVILAEQEFIGEEGRPFTVAEYKNMAGRAGRLGFSEHGKSIILAESSMDRDMLFNRYVMGQPEAISSSFDVEQLPTWIVRLLAQVKSVLRVDVPTLLANTYGGYVSTRDNPSWKPTMERHLEELLSRMVALNLVEEEGDRVRLTLLGRACGQSALSFDSAMRLVELLRAIGPESVDATNLIATLQSLRESDGGYTPLMRRGRAESIRPKEASERYGTETVRALQRFAEDEFDYFARCKRAAILWDWITGVPVEQIERQYSPNPYQGHISHGDIRKFADATRYHLRSAHQILSVLFIDQGPSEESIELLLRQLELGLPATALPLAELPISLARGEYLALHSRGITSVANVWALTAEELGAMLGKLRATQLEAYRKSS